MKLNRALTITLTLAAMVGVVSAQDAPPKKAPASPAAETSATIGGKTVNIKYSAPSVKGRKIFGGTEALLPASTVWRVGANKATALHTDGDITIGDLKVPAGDYTLYVLLDAKAWQLIVSKQTGQWGIAGPTKSSLDETKELGRVPMKMSKPAAMVETFKITLAGEGKKGSLALEWEHVLATVAIAAQ